MKKLFLLLCCSLLILPTKAQNMGCPFEMDDYNLGIGMVVLYNIDGAKLTLYNDSACTKIYTVISHNHFSHHPDSIACPQYYKPDYGIFHYICLGKLKNGGFKIAVNGTQVKYVKATNDDYGQYSWKTYLRTGPDSPTYKIRRRYGLPVLPALYKLPSDTAATIPVTWNPDHESFCVLEVKDDWLKVQLECVEHEDLECHETIKNCPDKTAWFKWREGNKLLIDIFFFP